MSLAPAVLRSTSTLGNAGVDIPIGNRFVIAGARLLHRDGRMSTISVVELISATTLGEGGIRQKIVGQTVDAFLLRSSFYGRVSDLIILRSTEFVVCCAHQE